MKAYSLKDRILGSLISSGIGDALGAAVEGFSPAEIRSEFGRVTGFVDPSGNMISPDNQEGEITDDSSQLVEMAKVVIETGGRPTTADAAKAILNWSENWPKYYPRNAGNTTKHVIEALREGQDPQEVALIGKFWERGNTNGCVMRIAPAGLIHPGDLEGAIETAVVLTSPSHGTQNAYSSACAVSCAIAEAMTENSTVWSVVRAAMYGARRGEAIGIENTREALGASLCERAVHALSAVSGCQNMLEAEENVCTLMGDETFTATGTVAVALAMFAAADGDTMNTLLSCVNMGGDADTVACVAGMIAGAFNGCDAIDANLYEEFRRVNVNIDYETLADGLERITRKGAELSKD